MQAHRSSSEHSWLVYYSYTRAQVQGEILWTSVEHFKELWEYYKCITSIGFSIPFHNLWKRSIVWKGIVCSIVMMLGKMVVGIWVPIWTPFRRRREGVAHPTGDTGGDAIIGGKVEA